MFKQTRSNLKKENVITNKEMRKIKVGSFRYKKAALSDWMADFIAILMVPEARLELARFEKRGILNPLCLPISPLGHYH